MCTMNIHWVCSNKLFFWWMHVVHLLIRNVWRNAAPRLTPVSFSTLMIIIAPRRRWCECCFMKWVGRFRVPIKASRTDTTDGGLFSDTSECWVRSENENDYNEMKWDEMKLSHRIITLPCLHSTTFVCLTIHHTLRRVLTKRSDSTKQFCWDESHRSRVHTKKSDSTKQFSWIEAFIGANTSVIWPISTKLSTTSFCKFFILSIVSFI